MARVLQRRPSPPYLLIVFVFLFLVSTTLAVLFYTKLNDARKTAEQEQQERKKLAGQADMGKPYVEGRLAEPAEPSRPPKETDTIYDPQGRPDSSREADLGKLRTVVARLDENLRELAGLVSPEFSPGQGDSISLFLGAAGELKKAQAKIDEWKKVNVQGSTKLGELVEEAEAEVAEWAQSEEKDDERVKKIVREARNLLAKLKAIELLHGKVAATGAPATSAGAKSPHWAGVFAELETAYEEKLKPQIMVSGILKADVAERDKTIKAKTKKIENLEKKNNDLFADKQRLGDDVSARNTKIEELKSELKNANGISDERKKRLDRLTEQLNSKAEEVNKLTKDLDEANATIERLKLEKRAEDIRTYQALLANPPDGKITEIVENQDLCYIDRGLEDGVDVYHTFAVYPKTGVPPDLKSKGRITVIKAYNKTSACRITAQEDKSRIEVGDLVANLAYETRRSFKFYLEGEFDLRNTGRTSPVDKQEVAWLIRRFGGETVKELTAEVDYVVLGVRPIEPKGIEDLTPEARALRTALRQAAQRYKEVQQKASKIGIPILNTNRFLDLVGYTPTARRPGL
ncbi:MAG: hypothetical protein ACYTF6_11755 [Planctomycetota bacterium]|jgi:hypothetical protein